MINLSFNLFLLGPGRSYNNSDHFWRSPLFNLVAQYKIAIRKHLLIKTNLVAQPNLKNLSNLSIVQLNNFLKLNFHGINMRPRTEAPFIGSGTPLIYYPRYYLNLNLIQLFFLLCHGSYDNLDHFFNSWYS